MIEPLFVAGLVVALAAPAHAQTGGGSQAPAAQQSPLANQEVMQHIFGDVVKRQVVGEVRLTF